MMLAEKLQILRNNSRLSQEELADILGVSRQAVSKWESGLSTPDLKKLIRLAEIYNVTIDSLVKDEQQLDMFENTDINISNEEVVEHEKKNNTQIVINLNSNRIEYEYTSKRQLFGIPLVHINLGRGLKKAKGIIAIGNIACGLISIGFISLGVISFGLLSLGLLALGVLTIGVISIGAISIGIFSLGALAFGKYAAGACAIASDIAIGDYARANIAIGNKGQGTNIIPLDTPIDSIINIIKTEYPKLSDKFIRVIEFIINNTGMKR